MKKFLSLLIALMMVFSVVGFAYAEEEEEPNPEPEFVRPVEITAVDEDGNPIDGVELRISDENDHQEIWNTDNDQLLFLKEGSYLFEGLTAPEGYFFEEAVPVVVERTEDERETYIGNCVYDHDHPEICSNPNHLGLELYSVTNGEKTIVGYCFNHLLKNPNGNEYKKYPASAELLFRYARNKSKDIEQSELYDHVMYILQHADDVQAKYHLDDAVTRFLTYIAIKTYTDPKCYYEFDDEGNSLLIRDENNRPVRDENGKYKFKEGGTVLGAVVHHAKAEDHAIPQDYIKAYNELIKPANVKDYDNTVAMYFYYPAGYDIESDQSYQILMTAEPAVKQEVKIGVRPAALFRITVKWSDSNNKENLRPSPEALISKLHLYAGGEEVTAQYIDGVTVTDNGDNTYTVKFANLLPEDYTMKIDAPKGYLVEKKAASDGGTITLTHLVLQKLDPIVRPITPIKPITPPWAKKNP